MENAVQTQNWKKIGLTHSVILPRKPEWLIVSIKMKQLSTLVLCKATAMGRNQSKFVLLETDTVENWKEQIPEGQLVQP